jgi:hypothetical protein
MKQWIIEGTSQLTWTKNPEYELLLNSPFTFIQNAYPVTGGTALEFDTNIIDRFVQWSPVEAASGVVKNTIAERGTLTATTNSWNGPTITAGAYGLDMRVPNLSAPAVTHIGSPEVQLIYKVLYVLNNNTVVVEDPYGTAVFLVFAELQLFNKNFDAIKRVQIYGGVPGNITIISMGQQGFLLNGTNADFIAPEGQTLDTFGIFCNSTSTIILTTV